MDSPRETSSLLGSSTDATSTKSKWSPPRGFLWIEIGKYHHTSRWSPLTIRSNIFQRFPIRFRRDDHGVYICCNWIRIQRCQHDLMAHHLIPYNLNCFPTIIRKILRYFGPTRLFFHCDNNILDWLFGLWIGTRCGFAEPHAGLDWSWWGRPHDNGHNHKFGYDTLQRARNVSSMPERPPRLWINLRCQSWGADRRYRRLAMVFPVPSTCFGLCIYCRLFGH